MPEPERGQTQADADRDTIRTIQGVVEVARDRVRRRELYVMHRLDWGLCEDPVEADMVAESMLFDAEYDGRLCYYITHAPSFANDPFVLWAPGLLEMAQAYPTLVQAMEAAQEFENEVPIRCHKELKRTLEPA